MRRNLFFVWCVLASWMMAASASAANVKFNLLGAADFTTLRFPSGTATTVTSKFGYGGGLNLTVMFDPHWSIDIGGSYLMKKYAASATVLGTSIETVYTEKALEIPLHVRFWAAPWFNLGLGGYFVKWLGDIDYSTSVNGTTTNGGAITRAGYAKTSDFGLSGVLGFDIPLGAVTGLVIDGRYNYGMANQSVGANYKMSAMQAFIGIRFGTSK